MGDVARSFSLAPSIAHEELGGRPLLPADKRVLVQRVFEAIRCRELREDGLSYTKQVQAIQEAKGDPSAMQKAKDAAYNDTKGSWTADDHKLWRDLMYAMGRTSDMRG